MQADDPTAVADRDHTAGRAPRQGLVGLHIQHDRALLARGDVEDVDALDTEDFIGPGAPGHTGTTYTVGHVRVFSAQLLRRC